MNFYFGAAKALDRLDAKEGSIKSVLATIPEKDRKRTTALVIETLKYKIVLADVIDRADMMKEERKKIGSLNLALVLVHDYLLSGGIQAGDGPIKQAILRHKTRLSGEFQKIKIKRGAQSNEELVQLTGDHTTRIPRYVRVNTLLCSSEEAMGSLLSRGFSCSDPFKSEKGFLVDNHVPNLFVFSPRVTFQDDPFYKAGKFILQDKASCFPAIILAPPSNHDSAVIDATAAPGNKTSLLSAIMKNQGKLFAFERDKKRFATLNQMLAKAGCENVEALNQDFLTVEPLDPKYRSVTHILLDPSCSGSGIVNRLDHLLENGNEGDDVQEGRLNRLSTFQVMILKHAMKFPTVRKIVYSTCSVHAVENEHVVRECLRSAESQVRKFILADPSQVLPQWPRRGLSQELDDPSQAASLIRCSPGEDATNGFFVACFIREGLNTQKRRAVVDGAEAHAASRKSKQKKMRKSQ